MASTDVRPSLLVTSSLSAVFLVVGKALTLGTVLLLSVLMSIEAFGDFIYARGIVLFFGPFMALGLTVTAMRRVPAYMEMGEIGLAVAFVRTAMSVALAVSCGVAFLLAICAPLYAPASQVNVLWVALPALPGFALMTALMQVARATGRIGLAYGPLSVGQPLTFALIMLALYPFLGAQNAVPATMAFSVTMLAAAAVQGVGIWRLPEFYGVKPTWQTRKWITEALPLTLSLGAQGVTAFGPLLILGIFVRGEELGTFGFYQAVMQGILVCNTAIFGAVNPRLSMLLAKGATEKATRLIRLARLAAFGVSTLAASITVVAVVMLTPWFQPAFASEPMALAVLVSSVAVNALSGPLGHVLIIEERRAWEVGTQCAAAALTVAIALITIPMFGLLGAALATLAAAVLRAATVHYLVHYKLGYVI